jgi:hypothetical protein
MARNDKNVLLLPIHFPGNPETYYLQFDTGSPYTVFYSDPIKNIEEISINDEKAKTAFFVGKTEISSEQFKIFKSNKVVKKIQSKSLERLALTSWKTEKP